MLLFCQFSLKPWRDYMQFSCHNPYFFGERPTSAGWATRHQLAYAGVGIFFVGKSPVQVIVVNWAW